MSNNIVSFQVSKSPSMFSINNVSAGKNIKTVTLMEVQNLQNKDTSTGYDDNINFSETGIQEYTLEELLAEGATTQAEIQQVRAEEEARRLAEEQARILAEQQRQYEEQQRLYEQQLKELEDLYKARDENNGLFHPIKEAEIEAQIEALEKELNVPHQPDGWDQFVKMAENPGATAVTFVASAVEGIADVGESIVDGAVQIVGGAASYVVGAIDEDAGKAMQEGIQEFVSTDWTGKGYDAFVNAAGIDPEIAYGPAHSAGQIVGQVAGYAAISMIPGAGPAVTAVVGGLAAAGSAAESAYANGATFNEAMVVSTVAGVVGGVAGAASNQLGTVAKTSTTALDVVKYTAAGAGVGMVEPIVNSGVEYATYGNNDGKSYFEYMEESGGYQKVLMGAGSGAISTGSQAYGSYKSGPRRDAIDSFKNDPDVTDYNNKIDIAKKVNQADQAAKYYSKNGIMDEDTFYQVWGAPKGSKPDPSEYLPEKYINNHLSVAQEEGVSRYTSKSARDYHEANGHIGYSNEYSTGDVKYTKGSEFMTNSKTADDVISTCSNSDDLAKKLNVKPYEGEVYRYDIDASTPDLDIRMPSGNEPGAYRLDWIPGGKTLDGTYEVVVNGVGYSDVKVTEVKYGGN